MQFRDGLSNGLSLLFRNFSNFLQAFQVVPNHAKQISGFVPKERNIWQVALILWSGGVCYYKRFKNWIEPNNDLLTRTVLTNHRYALYNCVEGGQSLLTIYDQKT